MDKQTADRQHDRGHAVEEDVAAPAKAVYLLPVAFGYVDDDLERTVVA